MKINGNDLSMVRGDSARLTLTLKDSSGTALTGISQIKMTARRNYDSTLAIFTKTATDNVITLNPADTATAAPGVCVYDIEVTFTDGRVFTPVVGKFNLLPDVSR